MMVYQELCSATDLRMGTLNVFLDTMCYKDVHLHDGMVSTNFENGRARQQVHGVCVTQHLDYIPKPQTSLYAT